MYSIIILFLLFNHVLLMYSFSYEGDPSIATPALLSPIIRSLFRLWCHENTRTYCDRLLNDSQRYWFSSVLHDLVMEHFCQGVEDLIPAPHKQPERNSLFPSTYFSVWGFLWLVRRIVSNHYAIILSACMGCISGCHRFHPLSYRCR